MSPKELEQDAANLIATRLDAGEVVHAKWAVQELLNIHADIAGNDVDFYILCAREHVYRVIKKVIDRYEKPEDDEKQMLLVGYEFLRVAYPVERDKERVVVPIHQLTDEELTARANEFRTQAGSLLRHADEIDSFIEKRRAADELMEAFASAATN